MREVKLLFLACKRESNLVVILGALEVRNVHDFTQIFRDDDGTSTPASALDEQTRTNNRKSLRIGKLPNHLVQLNPLNGISRRRRTAA